MCVGRGVALWRLKKKISSKVADQLWMRGDLSSDTKNRYPAQLYGISQDANHDFIHHLLKTPSEMQSVSGSTNNKGLTSSQRHGPSRRGQTWIKRHFNCTHQVFTGLKRWRLWKRSSLHTQPTPQMLFPTFCHWGNYFLMTPVHNLYTASVVVRSESLISLPKESLSVRKQSSILFSSAVF